VDEAWFDAPFDSTATEDCDAENQPANTRHAASGAAQPTAANVHKLLFLISALPQTPTQLATYLDTGEWNMNMLIQHYFGSVCEAQPARSEHCD
jgi:hypothetical protein